MRAAARRSYGGPMNGARRRLTTAAGALVLGVLASPVGALAQNSGESDTGHKDAGESASAWDAGGWAFWTVIVLALLAVLVLVLVFTARRGGGSDDEDAGAGGRSTATAEAPAQPAATAQPVVRAVEDETPAAGWELVVLGFEAVTDAEHAYATVREHTEGDPLWLHDVAFAEAHRNGRVLLRGTFAG